MEAGIAAIQRAAGGCGREGARPARGAARAARWSLLFLLLAASRPAFAAETGGGALWLGGADGDPARAVAAPLLQVDVAVRVTGSVAHATVTQRFHNPADRWTEGAYGLPLPERAAVDGLRMRVGERVVEGEVREREQARRRYERARDEGHRASLVVQRRPDLFTTGVTNMAPGAEIEVAVDLQWTLRRDGEEHTLRLPWIAAPRFVPDGAGTTAAEAGPVAPAGPRPDVALAIDFDPGLPVTELASPTHAVALEHLGPTRLLITLHEGTAPADRDFVLRWRPVAGTAPRAALFSEAHDGAHYVLLHLVPPEPEALPRPPAREVVFVVDTSGSMDGPSIRQAREALALALRRLRPEDRFNVVAFDDDTRALFPAPVRADRRHVDEALAWVGRLAAGGGTRMAPALAAALRDPDPERRGVRQVVFVTDGCVGNERELFALIRARLGRTRLFTVGIGAAPNARFMAGAARFGRGSHVDVAAPGELAARMATLFARLEHPAVTDLEVAWHDAVEVWPARLPDLHAGEPLWLVARLERLVGEVVVRGRRGDAPWEVHLPLEARPPPAAAGPGPGIARLWAREKVRARMDDLVAGADPERVRADVLEVALRHGIVSRWTSLVAVDRTPVRPRGETLARGDVAAGLPAGWRLPQGATAAPWWTLLSGSALTAAGLLYVALAVARRKAA